MNVDDSCIHRIRNFQNRCRNMADFGHHEIRGSYYSPKMNRSSLLNGGFYGPISQKGAIKVQSWLLSTKNHPLATDSTFMLVLPGNQYLANLQKTNWKITIVNS